VAETSQHELAARTAELARALAGERTLEDVLENVTAAAVELIPAVDTAGILLVKKGGSFESLATTSELAHQLAILQTTFDEGPCV
jgi:hypothetical protein